ILLTQPRHFRQPGIVAKRIAAGVIYPLDCIERRPPGERKLLAPAAEWKTLYLAIGGRQKPALHQRESHPNPPRWGSTCLRGTPLAGGRDTSLRAAWIRRSHRDAAPTRAAGRGTRL